jgi:hypothetical protein
MDFDIDRELADIDALLLRYKSVVDKGRQEEFLKVWIVFWAVGLLARAWKKRKNQEITGEHLLLACYLPVAAEIVFKEICT